jgi:steroid 5-alpha reductase family enzyme
MTVLYLGALAAMAVSLAILMAGAWVVQQRTGNSGWVDTIWTFALGLVGAGSALWPVAGAAPNARQWLVAALVAIWSLRLGTHIAIRTAGTTATPRRESATPRRLQTSAISLDYPWGWATLLAPFFMYWILVHITGIPPLEAQMLRSRGDRYRDYQSRTSPFFPLPPHA